MQDLFAKCGNNCGRCPLHVGNLSDDTRAWCAQGMGAYHGWNPKPEGVRACAGCQSSEGFMFLRNCPVRLCAQHSDVETCAHCSVFPCEYVPTVSLPAGYRAQVEEKRGEPVPEADYLAFIEPYEGMKHLEAIRAPLDPSQLVDPPPPKPLRARIAAFPDDMAFPGGLSAGYRALYDLLSGILTGRAELFVQQATLHKQRHNILYQLWLFGRYGRFPEEDVATLVIDSDPLGSSKEFTGAVRKRDNALHATALVSTRLLQDFGVTIEHVPTGRRDWLLKMTVDPEAGGERTLRALQAYAKALVQEYGEPTFRGAYRYQGEAYGRFSRADILAPSSTADP
jgi:hypothetical protein